MTAVARPSTYERTLTERMRDAVQSMIGWQYTRTVAGVGREVPQFPWPIPGVRGLIVVDGPGRSDCCSFVESVIVRAFRVDEWGLDRHRQAMLVDKRQPFSPCDVLISAGLTTKAASEDRAWHVIQGWRVDSFDDIAEPSARGHTFIVESSRGVPTITVHECNVRQGVDSWATTWRAIEERYPVRRMVRLAE